MIHISRGRRVTSRPLTHGRSTSLLGRPLGLSGACSQLRASSPGNVEGAALGVAHEGDRPAFSGRRLACVKIEAPRGKIGVDRLRPGRHQALLRSSSAPAEAHHATPAPPRRRLSRARRSRPRRSRRLSAMGSSTRRLAPPRIELVETSPTRLAPTRDNGRPSLGEPVADEIGLGGHARRHRRETASRHSRRRDSCAAACRPKTAGSPR